MSSYISFLNEMSNKYKIIPLIGFLFLGNCFGIAQTQVLHPTPTHIAVNNSIAQTLATTNSYINYVENKGQWYNKVLYQGDFNGGRIFLEKNALTYLFFPPGGLERLHPNPNGNPQDFVSCSMTFQAVRMEFENSLPASVEGGDRKEFYNNYFLGNDRSKWASGVPVFGEVNYNSIYPGISIKVFSDLNNVRYDFLIEPHADITKLKMRFTGQNYLSMKDGQLVIHTEIGDIAQARPIAYQEVNGKKVNVDCDFVLNNDEISFNIKGPYNASLPLVIDPTLVFATFSGSTADNWGMSATYDAMSNAYTSGIAFSAGYPVTPGAFQVTFQGGGTGGGNHWPWPDSTGFDIVISKFNPTGTTLLFSTYLGGNDNEEPQSLVVDNTNNLLVLGRTYSTNFPTTPGAYSNTSGGGADLSITKFDSSGVLLASTYVGGSGDDGVNISAIENFLGSLKHNYADDGRGDIVVDNNNNVYVASCTSSPNFPTTAGAIQSSSQGMQDGCAFKMSSNLTTMLWGTYLGGSSDDAAYNIALNSKNEAYVAGGTSSSNFPTTPTTLQPAYSGAIDGFVVHLSTTGTLLQSTYLGTSGYDQAFFVQTDKYNNVYAYGQTSGNYPITAGVYSNPNSGQFIHEMDPTLSKTIFSTEFGSGRGVPDIAPSAFLVDNCLNIYISGWAGDLYGYNGLTSSSIGLPVTSNAYRSTPNVLNNSWTGNVNNGEDFYFMVMQKQASSLWYATYFGSTGGNNGSLAHVDGGTSRFDKRGVIYQAICGGCGGYSDIPTTPGAWSATNKSPNCNNALVKFKMDLLETIASFIISPNVTAGCAPFAVNFKNITTYGHAFRWFFGNGDTSSVVSPTYTYTKPGTYKVMLIATDSTTCNVTDTGYATVRVVVPLTFTAPSTFVCLGDSVALTTTTTGAIGAAKYTWSPSNGLNDTNTASPHAAPLGSATYYVSAKDSFCTVIDTVHVQVYTNTTKIIPRNDQLCLGDSLALTTDSSFVSYVWSTGSTASSIEARNGGPYFVATTDKHGCKGKDSVEVLAFSKVPLTEFDTTICQNTIIHLYADSGNYKYTWEPPYGLSAYNIYNPVAKPFGSVTYTVTVTNGPCVSKDSSVIKIKPMPTVQTMPDSMMVLPGQVVTLNAIGTPPFTWSPTAELSCTMCATTVVKVDSNTVFYVQVADSDGCKALDSVIVDVLPTMYIPDAFTPNGDGLNDVFRPKFTGYSTIEVYIFDRWGQLIYHWNTLDGGWDGTMAGKKVEEDTYVYMLKAVTYFNQVYQKIGSVTVIR